MKIYLLSCADSDEGGGIYECELSENGTLNQTDYFACDRPMYAVLKENKLHVLLCQPLEDDIYSGYFTLNADLTQPSAIKSTLGKCACHLAVSGDDTYIVNYLSGNLSKNGESAVYHAGKGVSQPRQDGPHTHFTAVSKDGKYVFCTDLGLDTLYVYDRNLKEITCAKVPEGYGIRHLAFSDDEKIVYAVNELVPSVSVFTFDNGALELKNTLLLPCEKTNLTAAAIRRGKGNLLYVSVRGENAVFVLKADKTELETVGKYDCGGIGPRDFDVFGNFMVVCNENSHNAAVFRLDEKGFIAEKTCDFVCRGVLNCLKAE